MCLPLCSYTHLHLLCTTLLWSPLDICGFSITNMDFSKTWGGQDPTPSYSELYGYIILSWTLQHVLDPLDVTTISP